MRKIFTRIGMFVAFWACGMCAAFAENGDVVYTYFPATSNSNDAAAVAESQAAGYEDFASAVLLEKKEVAFGSWTYNDNKRRLCLAYDMPGVPATSGATECWAFLKPVTFARAATYEVELEAVNQVSNVYDATYEVWLCSTQGEDGLEAKLYAGRVEKTVSNSFAELAGVTKFSFDIVNPGQYGLALCVTTDVPGNASMYNGCRFRNIKITEGEGIDAISIASVKTADAAVYDLHGVKVLDRADKGAVNRLPKGVYVQNGKKLMVK